jgi:hypothetical protein
MKKMKQFFILLTIVLFIWACSGPKAVVEAEKDEPETDVEMDSVSYVIETYDAKFKAWYDLHKSPETNRPQKYYENWNKKYVKEWNRKSTQKEYSDFFVPIVGYNRTKDLGFEINHQLFYYFQYVENVLKIQILPDGPKVVTE